MIILWPPVGNKKKGEDPRETLRKKGKERGPNILPEFLYSGQADTCRAARHFFTWPRVSMPDPRGGGWRRGSPLTGDPGATGCHLRVPSWGLPLVHPPPSGVRGLDAHPGPSGKASGSSLHVCLPRAQELCVDMGYFSPSSFPAPPFSVPNRRGKSGL